MKSYFTFIPGVLGLGLLCLALPALAVNFNFMRNSPISQFDEKDLEIFNTSVIEALDTAGDGETIRWENPDSGHNGQVFMLSSDESSGQLCRRIRLVNVAGSLNSNIHYNACKDDVAGWQIVPAKAPPATTEQDPVS
jgi:surface antigen